MYQFFDIINTYYNKIYQMNQLSPYHFEKLVEGRGIKLRNSKLQLDRLLNALKSNPHDVKINIIESCADPDMRQGLRDLVKYLAEMHQRGNDRFYEPVDYLARSQSNLLKLSKNLDKAWQQKHNVFTTQKRQVDIKSQKFDIILLITSPIDIVQINILTQGKSIKIQFFPKKMTRNVYAFSYIDKELMKAPYLQIEIKTIDLLLANKSIVIKDIQAYERRYRRAGIIMLQFSQNASLLTQTTGVLYSIGALSFKNNSQIDHFRFLQYSQEWLSLFNSLCFIENREQFQEAVNFQVNIVNDEKKNRISRPYIYLLSQLSKNLYSKDQFLHHDNLLMNSLPCPLLDETYKMYDYIMPHYIIGQKMYIQFCLYFSMRKDKQAQTKATNLNVALLNIGDQDSLKLMQQFIKQYPQIMAFLPEKTILQTISNKYLLQHTAFWLVSQIIRIKKKMKVKIEQDQLIIKCLAQIHKKNCYQKDALSWDKEPNSQDLKNIVFKQGKFIFKDQHHCSVFYSKLKKISHLDGIYQDMLRICKPFIRQIFKQAKFNKQLLQCLTVKPFYEQDNLLLRKSSFSNESLKNYHNLLYERLAYPSLFSLPSFDEAISKFVENHVIKTQSTVSLKQLSVILNHISNTFPTQKQNLIIELFEKIMRQIKIGSFINLQQQTYQILLTLTKLENNYLKQMLRQFIKKMVCESKIHFSQDILDQCYDLYKSFDLSNRDFYRQFFSLALKPHKVVPKLGFYWNILLKNQKCGKVLEKKKYTDSSYHVSIKAVEEKLENDDLYITDLEDFCKNTSNFKQYQQEIGKNLCIHINKCNQQFQHFKQKLRNIKLILEKFDHLGFELDRVTQFERTIRQSKLQNIYEFQVEPPQIKELFQKSIQINELVLSSPHFLKDNILKIQDILQQYQQIKNINKLKIIQFQQSKNYTYKSYRELLKQKSLERWYYILFKENSVLQKINKIKQQNLDKYCQIIKAYVKIRKQIENIDDKKYEKFILLNQEKQQRDIKELLAQTLLICQYLRVDFNIDPQSDIFKDEMIQVVLLTSKYSEMFHKLKQANIQTEVLINLKETIISEMYLNINMENIQQFQSVVSFSKEQKKHKTFIGFINKVRKDTSQHKIALSENISHCSQTYQQILQKIKNIENQQTSFRMEIELIFKEQSKCKLKNQFNHPLYCFQFELILQMFDHRVQKSRKFKMKQLKDMQEKSLIFKTEFSKNKDDKEALKAINKFLEFYLILQQLRINCETLLLYGYNPMKISVEIEIDNSLTKLKDEVKIIQTRSNFWKQNVKDFYKQSYLFTFYPGKDIRLLIEQVSKKKLPKNIENICSISQRQLQQIYQTQAYSSINQNDLKDYQKLKRSVQLLREINNKMQEPKAKSYIKSQNKITLNFTTQSNYIYQFNRQPTPKIYQTFYCLQQTSLLELQIFLCRCFSTYSSINYIIGAQFIKQEIKNEFFQLIKSIQKEKENKNIELRFIDSNKSDILYYHLKWCTSMEVVETKEAVIYNNIQSNKKTIQKLLNNVQLVTSYRPGLGKTYYVERQQKDINNLIYFPIAGNIDFKNILKRLKKLDLMNKCMLIQIGYIQRSKHQTQSMNNIQKLQILLSMILLLRAFYYEGEYIYFNNIKIFIELQNQIQNQGKVIGSQGILLLLKILKKHYHIQQFDAENIFFDQSNLKQVFVLKYLQIYDNKKINKINIDYQDIQLKRTLEEIQLIQEILKKNNYFYEEKFDMQKIRKKFIEKEEQEIIIQYTGILKFIAPRSSLDLDLTSFEVFKDQIKEKLQELKEKASQPIFPQSKTTLIQTYFVNNCSITPSYRSYHQFINILFDKIKTFSNSYSLNIQQIKYFQDDYFLSKTGFQKLRQDFFKVLLLNAIKIIQQTVNSIKQNKNQTGGFYNNINSNPTIILSSHDKISYQFINHKAANVQFSIKSLFCSQSIQFFQKVQQKNYRFWRIKQDITKQFESQAFDCLQDEKKEQKMISTFFHISGNNKFNKPLKEVYQAIKGFQTYKLTLDNFYKICYIIQKVNSFSPIILMGESGVGKTSLLKFTVNEIFQQTLLVYNVHAGIHVDQLEKWVEQIKEKAHSQKDSRLWVFFDQFNTSQELSYIKQIVIDRRFQGQKLPSNILFLTACNPYRNKLRSASQIRAFNVKPPNPSMINLMWDYEQLRDAQCESYCYKILKQIPYKLKETVLSIVKIHKYIHRQYQLSYASLRDVSRFKELYFWFYRSIPKKPLENLYNQQQYSTQNYQLELYQRSLILAFCFVYQLKFSKGNQRQRLMEIVENQFQFKWNFMQQVLKRQQIDYVIRLKAPNMKLAYNKALRENLFTSFVCILNKIPVILIGSPGSSKSLSVRLINSNLRGKFSKNEFCKQFPQFMFHYFQGSQSSTSQSIQKAFSIAQKPKPKNTEYLVVFDELGIAQKSIHNPTKVLHSKLETDSKAVSIIALSNHQLDCSKMSRFLVVKRQQPQREELIQTSKKIYQSFSPKNIGRQKIVENFAIQYEKFRDQYSMSKVNNYYGQRDFYCSLRHICYPLASQNEINKEHILREAIRINYDGHRDEQGNRIWLQKFLKYLDIKPLSNYPSVKQLIQYNLNSLDSRYLLFIVKQDSIIQEIIQNQIFEIKNKRKSFTSIYCSPFLKDNQSEQYNIEFTSNIISQMSKGSIISIKDLNNSIQTSLYDLFNKAFMSINQKSYCRVVVGATSNAKCYVHSQFSVIIFMNEENYQNIEGAFLNRFEKHFVTILDELTSQQHELLAKITNWIQKLGILWKDKKLNCRQNYLLNSNQYSLASLIIKYRQKENNEDKKLRLIKQKILQNSTTDFDILINMPQSKIESDLEQEIKQILKKIKKQFSNQYPLDFDKRDLVIFTYGSFDDFKEIDQKKQKFSNAKAAFIKINETQKALKQDLIKQFNNKDNKIIQIYLNLQKQGKIISYALHLLQKIKKQNNHKQIRIIIQLNRHLIYKNSIQEIHNSKINKINISFMHDYEQCFYDPKVESIIASSLQKQIFEFLFTKNLLEDIYQTCVLKLNIQVNNGKSNNKCITFLMDLLKEQSFVLSLCSSIKTHFKDNQIKYQQIIVGKKDDSENAKNFISSSTMKEIFINYLKPNVIQIVQTILDIFFQKNMIFKLTSSYETSQKSFSNDMKCKAFRLYFESEKNVLKNQSSDCWKIVEKDLSKRIDKVCERQQNRFQVVGQIYYFYLETSQIIKYIFKISKNQNSLEILSNRLYSLEQSEQNEEKIQENQRQISQFVQKNLQVHLNFSRGFARQFLLLNDIIKFHLNLLGLGIQQSSSITEIFLHLTKTEWSFTRGLLILLFKRQFAKLVYEAIIKLQTVLSVQYIKEVITQCRVQHEENRNQCCYFINVLLSTIFKCILIEKYKEVGIKQYSEFFNYFYQIALKFFSQSPNFDELLQFPKYTIIQNRLINLFYRIGSKQNPHQILQLFVSFEQNIFSELKIIRFCKMLLQKYRSNIDIQNQIIRFMACDLFGEFSENENLEINRQQIQNFCFSLSEEYPNFANLLTIKYFPNLFAQIFDQQLDNQKQIRNPNEQMLQIYSKIKQNKYLLVLKNNLSNLKIALGLYFKSAITKTIEKRCQSFNGYQKNSEIMKKYYKSYKQIDQDIGSGFKTYVSEIFSFEFLKIYYEKYVEIIIFKSIIPSSEQRQIFKSINEYFQKQYNKNQICKHMHIYLLKFIHRQIKQPEQLFKVIQEKKASHPQLNHWLSFLSNNNRKQNNYQLPLNLFDKSQQVYSQYYMVKQSRFQRSQTQRFVYECLKSPRKTYQFLTIIATFLYFDDVKDELKESAYRYINDIEQLNNKENIIIKRLIQFYFSKKAATLQLYKKIDDYRRNLPLLNFLNLICAYRKVKCSFIQMFFYEGAFQEAMREKYLFGTINNPQLVRCLVLQENHSKRYFYQKCQNCHYLKKMIGNQEQNFRITVYSSKIIMNKEQDCPFCGSEINPQKYGNLNKHMQVIIKKTEYIDPHSKQQSSQLLKGYQEGYNLQQIRLYNQKLKWTYQQEIYGFNAQSIERSKDILKLIQFFIWYVFKQMKFMQLDMFKAPNALKEIYEHYLSQVIEKYNIQQKDCASWMYKVAQILEKMIIQQSNNGQNQGLINQAAKINFEMKFNKLITNQIYLQYEKAMKINKIDRYPSNQNILQETGIADQHGFDEYKLIRLFKIVNNVQITTLQLNGLEYLVHSYHPLYYICKNVERIDKKYENLRRIYRFIYKIWLQFNFQLKREDERKSIKTILQNMQDQRQRDFLKQQLPDICEILKQTWKIEIPQQFSKFILDNKQKHSSFLLQFILQTAKQYNDQCFKLGQILRKHYKKDEKTLFFSSQKINPTLIGQQSFWKLSSQQVLQIINQNKYNSIIYGIQKYQLEYNQIQHILVGQLRHTNQLVVQNEQFKYFYFIDDDNQIQENLKILLKQSLTQVEKAEIEIQYKNKSNKEQFLKKVLESLQKMFCYLKYFKDNLQMTIGEFIRCQRQSYQSCFLQGSLIHQSNQQLQVHPLKHLDSILLQDTFQKISLTKLISLQQYLKSFSLKNKLVEKDSQNSGAKQKPIKDNNNNKNKNNRGYPRR